MLLHGGAVIHSARHQNDNSSRLKRYRLRLCEWKKRSFLGGMFEIQIPRHPCRYRSEMSAVMPSWDDRPSTPHARVKHARCGRSTVAHLPTCATLVSRCMTNDGSCFPVTAMAEENMDLGTSEASTNDVDVPKKIMYAVPEEMQRKNDEIEDERN